MATKSTKVDPAISIPQLTRSSVMFTLIGTSGMIHNSMSAKAQRDLLLPKKKTAADKATTMKHDPRAEYARSFARTLAASPTEIGIPASAVKAALAAAALNTPGIAKSDVLRLCYVPGDILPVWGLPELRMDVVRSADINRTPDVRTRGYMPEWVMDVEISFVTPNLSTESVANLLNNAGILIGLGDYRQEKGRGSFGAFRMATRADDALVARIKAEGGRATQIAAIENPEVHNQNAAELLAYYDAEVARRAA